MGFEPSDPLFAGVIQHTIEHDTRWMSEIAIQVGLPSCIGNHVWEKFYKDVKWLAFTKTVATKEGTDDTLTGGPRQVKLIFKSTFSRASREDERPTAWVVFEGQGAA